MAAEHFDLRMRLATGEPFLFSWMSIPSAELAAQVARLPFDGVCLDMQHGMIGFTDAAPMIANINAAGRPAIVRALWNDPATPGQAYDAGAVCVISPMVNTRAQAEALVGLRSIRRWVREAGAATRPSRPLASHHPNISARPTA